jgi:hypothetical protein
METSRVDPWKLPDLFVGQNERHQDERGIKKNARHQDYLPQMMIIGCQPDEMGMLRRMMTSPDDWVQINGQEPSFLTKDVILQAWPAIEDAGLRRKPKFSPRATINARQDLYWWKQHLFEHDSDARKCDGRLQLC